MLYAIYIASRSLHGVCRPLTLSYFRMLSINRHFAVIRRKCFPASRCKGKFRLKRQGSYTELACRFVPVWSVKDPLLVYPLICVCPKEVSLGLDQIRGQPFGAEGIEIRQ